MDYDFRRTEYNNDRFFFYLPHGVRLILGSNVWICFTAFCNIVKTIGWNKTCIKVWVVYQFYFYINATLIAMPQCNCLATKTQNFFYFYVLKTKSIALKIGQSIKKFTFSPITDTFNLTSHPFNSSSSICPIFQNMSKPDFYNKNKLPEPNRKSNKKNNSIINFISQI